MTNLDAPTPPTSDWFYVFRGQRQGPVDEAAVAGLIATGQIRPETLLWTEGMAEWLAAGVVPRWEADLQNAAAAGLGAAPPVAPGPIMVSRSAFVPTGYAGFWLRLVAYFLDSIILTVGIVASSMIVTLPIGILGSASRGGGGNPGPMSGLFVLLGCGMYVLPPILMWCYFALMESSRHQGTLGKMAMGLRVTTLEGERLTLGRATVRFLGRIISGLTLLVGYIMAGFTEKKQALHDIIAGTLVLKGRR